VTADVVHPQAQTIRASPVPGVLAKVAVHSVESPVRVV
jgi:hypothetical protein